MHETVQHIVDTHPRLFKGLGPVCSSDLPPGWVELVKHLCHEIESALPTTLDNTFEVKQIKEKFARLRFYWRLSDKGDIKTDIQSTEGIAKRPALRDGERLMLHERIEAMVRTAEDKSEKMCQICGEGGRVRTPNRDRAVVPKPDVVETTDALNPVYSVDRLATLCDAHAAMVGRGYE